MHVNRYSQTNDVPISNPFMFKQRSLYIDMFAEPPPLAYLKDMKTGRWRVNIGIGPEGSMLCANSPLPTPVTPSQCDYRSEGTRCNHVAMASCTTCQLDYGQQRNFCDKHVQRRCQLCGVGSFCTEHSDPRDHACVCHVKTFVPNKYHILSREAHCRIPRLASISEISFAKMWYKLSET